jgi:cyclophilin family peptidyl-prolyl cis-trans isomerase
LPGVILSDGRTTENSPDRPSSQVPCTKIPQESPLRRMAVLGMMGAIGESWTSLYSLQGDVTVCHRWKPIVACFCLILSAAMSGCSKSGDAPQAPTASLNGAPSTVGTDIPAPPKPAPDRHPVVVIKTSLGNITVELDRQKSLLTVDNFLSYVRDSFYNQTIIHQVYKGQGILGGGYNTNMVAKPARTPIFNEAQNGVKNRRGTIAMVRQSDAIHSATSQFFINVADNPDLDYTKPTEEGYGYCVFGKVTDGMDVVDKINNVSLHDTKALDRTPVEPVVVESIQRIR